jgi:hypothetical protein
VAIDLLPPQKIARRTCSDCTHVKVRQADDIQWHNLHIRFLDTRSISSILVMGDIPKYVRFEVFTAVNTKNAVFWDVTPCGSCKKLCLRGAYVLHHQRDKNRRARNNVTSN